MYIEQNPIRQLDRNLHHGTTDSGCIDSYLCRFRLPRHLTLISMKFRFFKVQYLAGYPFECTPPQSALQCSRTILLQRDQVKRHVGMTQKRIIMRPLIVCKNTHYEDSFGGLLCDIFTFYFCRQWLGYGGTAYVRATSMETLVIDLPFFSAWLTSNVPYLGPYRTCGSLGKVWVTWLLGIPKYLSIFHKH